MPMQAVHKHPNTGVDASAGVHHVLVALVLVVALCLTLLGIFRPHTPRRPQKLDRVEAIANRRVRVWEMAGDEVDRNENVPQSTADSRNADFVR